MMNKQINLSAIYTCTFKILCGFVIYHSNFISATTLYEYYRNVHLCLLNIAKIHIYSPDHTWKVINKLKIKMTNTKFEINNKYKV